MVDKIFIVIAIVVLLCIIFGIYCRRSSRSVEEKESMCGCSIASAIEPTLPKESLRLDSLTRSTITPDTLAGIDAALAENFEVAAGANDLKQTIRGLDYTSDNEYGVGDGFQDYLTSQAVTVADVVNHKKWIDDMNSNVPNNRISRPHIPDAHDSYSPIPWSVRPPRAVPFTGASLQQPDIDLSYYRTEPIIQG